MSEPVNQGSREDLFESLLRRTCTGEPAHDLEHVKRVVANAKKLGRIEGADMRVVLPAAWLHDCVTVEKDSPDRGRASALAAAEARRLLAELDYPDDRLNEIAHAIEAHSFSAGIEPRTVEAKVVQDADRLDALGAIGIARCFVVGGRLGRPIYADDDPLCRERQADDSRASLDHFFTKLLRLPESMQTNAGRREAERRAGFLEAFLAELEEELALDSGGRERERSLMTRGQETGVDSADQT